MFVKISSVLFYSLIIILWSQQSDQASLRTTGNQEYSTTDYPYSRRRTEDTTDYPTTRPPYWTTGYPTTRPPYWTTGYTRYPYVTPDYPTTSSPYRNPITRTLRDIRLQGLLILIASTLNSIII